MLTPAIIVLALLVLGAGIVIWATRRKPDAPHSGPRETDTGWNDPITPAPTPTPRDTLPPEDAPTAPPRPRP